MSKEAMKLALEALETIAGAMPFPVGKSAITALREALAEQPAPMIRGDIRDGLVDDEPALAEQPAQQDSTCSNALRAQGKAYPRTCKKCGLGPCVELAQQALNKKAENAREQPAQKCSYPYCGCNSKAWCKVERNEALDKKAENARELGLDYEPAQPYKGIADYTHQVTNGRMRIDPVTGDVGIGTPSPPAQRKPLTDEEIDLLINGRGDEDDDDYVEPTGDGFGLTDADLVRLVRRVEAAHGIKENT